MTDMTPPPIPPIGAIELPDPRGPINDDFKRGACYVARLVMRDDKANVITITIPNGTIECGKVTK